MTYQRGQRLTLDREGEITEEFVIVKVGKKYCYCRSAMYENDGVWRFPKNDRKPIARRYSEI